MSADAIAKKYSQALFEIAEASKKTATTAFELEQVVKIFSQPSFSTFFASPFNSVETKVMVAKAALEGNCSVEIFNFLVTVVAKERLSFLSLINEVFQGLVRAKGGETEGVLYVPNEISPEFKAQVESKLSAALNKKVKLQVEKDPALLSGYKASIGGWTIDDSAQFHLNKIKEDVLKNSNQNSNQSHK